MATGQRSPARRPADVSGVAWATELVRLEIVLWDECRVRPSDGMDSRSRGDVLVVARQSMFLAQRRCETPLSEERKGSRMLVHHHERSAGALAHGVAKSSDIQRARRELGEAELRAATQLQAAATRHRRHASRQLAAGLSGPAGDA